MFNYYDTACSFMLPLVFLITLVILLCRIGVYVVAVSTMASLIYLHIIYIYIYIYIYTVLLFYGLYQTIIYHTATIIFYYGVAN